MCPHPSWRVDEGTKKIVGLDTGIGLGIYNISNYLHICTCSSSQFNYPHNTVHSNYCPNGLAEGDPAEGELALCSIHTYIHVDPEARWMVGFLIFFLERRR